MKVEVLNFIPSISEQNENSDEVTVMETSNTWLGKIKLYKEAFQNDVPVESMK